MKRTALLAAAVSACLASGLAGAAEPATVVSGGDTTIVYVFPTSPQTFVPVSGLPSFLVMPGAEVPAIPTEVVYRVPQPASVTTVASASTVADLDCANFVGTVTISGPDRFGLDKDGDGIGCEPEDR